jgi:type IV pilus assembly protein PilE
MFTGQRTRRGTAGFTLLEVMITVVIVGILASIALPSYNYFITRSRITEATNALGDYRNRMEKFFLDNRSYLTTGNACAMTSDMNTVYNASAEHKFAMSCAATATTYTLTATGGGPMTGFTYTVTEQNAKTSAVPSGWTAPSPNNCWAIRKDGSCS